MPKKLVAVDTSQHISHKDMKDFLETASNICAKRRKKRWSFIIKIFNLLRRSK